MRKNSIALVVSLGVLSLLLGCSSENRPPGMPKLYPASILITQEGQPLEGASVILVCVDESIRWLVSGQTNRDGVARLVTHGQFSGAPAGKFKVCVTKHYHEDIGRKPKDILICVVHWSTALF